MHELEVVRDTYELALWLDDVLSYSPSAVANAISCGLYGFDVDEAESFSAWRKVYLGRYGRQSVLQWDHVLVTEIQRYLKELEALIKREGALDRLNEDG